MLAIDMIKLALKDRIQQIILITGDGDFVPAVEYVKEDGVKVHLRYAKNWGSYDLIKACDSSEVLDNRYLIDYRNKKYR